jgi:hypothetical protein
LSSGGSEIFATYTVTVKNTSSSNTMNTVRFVATTSVVGGLTGAKAPFKAVSAYTCTPTNADSNTIDCALGPLAPQQSAGPFTLTFTTPTSGSQIQLQWWAVFDSGTPPGNSNGDSGAGADYAIGLKAISDDEVASAVPARVEGTLETLTIVTGSNSGKATPSDPWTTMVRVPLVSSASSAGILETVIPGGDATCPMASNLSNCSRSALSIPGVTFSHPNVLKIFLRRDASTIRNGAKIDNAIVFYSIDPSNGETPGTCDGSACVYPMPVRDCTDNSWGALPQPGIPCIKSRTAFPKKNTPKGPVIDPLDLGDWLFEIWASNNGKYAN